MENEFRGREAAGVAYVKQDGRSRQLMYVKSRGTATELARSMDSPTWATVAQSPLGLLHTRAPTKGAPSDNVNNHPVVGYGWAVVHNGGIWNDDSLFTHFRSQGAAERPAAVDTVAINLVLGQSQAVEESLRHVCTLQGSASVAAVHVSRPDELVLFRLGGPPVSLYWLPAWAMLVWSSDSDGGKAVEDIAACSFAGFIQAYTLPDNTALHLTPAGLKRYELVPKPYGPLYQVFSGRGAGGGSYLGFLPRGPQTGKTTATTATRKKAVIQGQSLAVLVDNTGLLEDPLFAGSRQEYHYLNQCTSYVSANAAFVLPTGYGRWFLTRTPDGNIAKEFKPHKRVRRRWEEEFGDDNPGAYVVSLPASEKQQDDLSDLLRLGRVDLTVADGSNIPALLCPWCGALRHPLAWASRVYECEWCNVKSLPPKEVSNA